MSDATLSTEHSRLDPEFKAKWVAALRSGKYQQGCGRLRNELNEFCCLGVALDLIDPKAWSGIRWNELYGTEIGVTASLIGLPRKDSSVYRLAEMNDGEIDRKHSFTEIADWIEANL